MVALAKGTLAITKGAGTTGLQVVGQYPSATFMPPAARKVFVAAVVHTIDCLRYHGSGGFAVTDHLLYMPGTDWLSRMSTLLAQVIMAERTFCKDLLRARQGALTELVCPAVHVRRRLRGGAGAAASQSHG